MVRVMNGENVHDDNMKNMNKQIKTLFIFLITVFYLKPFNLEE